MHWGFCIRIAWLVESLHESAFFFALWSVHIVKLKILHTESRAVYRNDPKDIISVVHVNKMLATVSR